MDDQENEEDTGASGSNRKARRKLTGKRKRVHLDAADLEQYEQTAEGSQALTAPSLVKKSSRDPNARLHPSFKTAREVYNPTCSFMMRSTAAQSSPTKPKRRNYRRQQSNAKQGDGYQQCTVDSFFRVKTPESTLELATTANSDCNENIQQSSTPPCSLPSSTPPCSLPSSTPPYSLPKRTLMRSPVKKVPGSSSLYTIDLTQHLDDDFTDLPPHLSTDSKGCLGFQKATHAFSNASLKHPSDQKAGKSTNISSAVNTTHSKARRNHNHFHSSLSQTSNSSLPGASASVSSSHCPASSSDKYGLLGSGNVPQEDFRDDGICFFDLLPLEVMENIFCRMPLMDLCLNLSRVCKRWNVIISCDKFLPWKKTYFRVLAGESEEKSRIVSTMRKSGMRLEAKETVLPGLIVHMKQFKPVTALNMLECLLGHPKYLWAEDLLKERLPEFLNPWSVITALVILSDSVDDVSAIIHCLLQPASQCTAPEVVECLYCIAAYLLVLKSLHYKEFWTRLHYRLYYALYLFENESSATCGQLSQAFSHGRGQQTILKYGSAEGSVRYTHEQLRICNHNVEKGEILKIVAFAGTGKTTTLVRYTQLRPKFKFLLVVYNKSMSEHAKGCFPCNVEVRTSHSLAFGAVGWKYKSKLRGNLKVNDILDCIEARKGENLFVQAKFVQDTVSNFLASADRGITPAHVPLSKVNDKGIEEYVGAEQRENLARDAQIVWSRMVDFQSRMLMTHDGYLKLYQLQKPKFNRCDIILIDEAQDLTPAVADILLSQQQPKLLVGDPHQQIYSFRGAVNAMDMVRATTVYYLTQSFRFGSEIAFVAACCLELLKGEKKKILVGNSSQGTITGETNGQVAVITRSNFTLFNEAVKKCCYSEEAFRGAFAGGLQAFGFDMIMDIYHLMLPPDQRKKEGAVIRHPLVQKFQNLGDLEKYASKTMDNELLGKIRIVRSHNVSLPSHIRKIKAKCAYSLENADIVFTTAHKAKGLEFSTVRVTDDYYNEFKPADSSANSPGEVGDELNLLYVAVTRAKRALQLTPTLMRLLDLSGEKFRHLVHTKRLVLDSPELTCHFTDRVFQPCAVTLRRKHVSLGCGTKVEAALYCPQVVTEDIPSLARLVGNPKKEREGELTRVRSERRWEANLPHLSYQDFMEGVLQDFEDQVFMFPMML